MVYFPKPQKEERKLIWERTLPSDLPLADEVNLENLIGNYEITASQISSIVQACFIDAIAKKEKNITQQNLLKNMRLEFKKQDLLFESNL